MTERTLVNNERKAIFKATYGVEKLEDVVTLFTKEYRAMKNDSQALDKVQRLFQKYVLAITFLYSLSSIKNNLKLFRNAIKKEGGIWQEMTIKSFYIFDVFKTVSNNTIKKIEERELKEEKTAINVLEEIAKTKQLLKTRKYHVAPNQDTKQVRSYYLVYLLGLSSGRRFTELMKTISIIKDDAGKAYYQGILKKESKNELVEVNLLGLTVSEVEGYIKELRQYINQKLKKDSKATLKDVTEGQINSKFSKVYNNAIKRISKKKINNVHELRHLYTIEGMNQFKKDGESKTELRYRILGHYTKDTTRTYKTAK